MLYRRIFATVGLFLSVSLGASQTSAANCGVNCYLAYGVNKLNNGPVLGGGGGVFSACTNYKFHVNFGGTAVAEVKVLSGTPGYVSCNWQTVRVMNGNFQNGPVSAQSTPANQATRQSLVGGNVLLGRYTMGTPFGQTWYNGSYTNTNGCGV